MTQDDTFRMLRRPTHTDMREIWASSTLYQKCIGRSTEDFNQEIDEFFESYGWHVEEYANHYKTN